MPSHTHGHLAAFSTLLAHDEQASGLHMRDLQVLALIVAHDTPLTVGAIASMLSVSSPLISRVVEKLVQQDLLTRTGVASDRRIVLLQPTEAGRALDDRIRAHYQSAALA